MLITCVCGEREREREIEKIGLKTGMQTCAKMRRLHLPRTFYFSHSAILRFPPSIFLITHIHTHLLLNFLAEGHACNRISTNKKTCSSNWYIMHWHTWQRRICRSCFDRTTVSWFSFIAKFGLMENQGIHGRKGHAALLAFDGCVYHLHPEIRSCIHFLATTL
jgi:hypothetical protein